MRPSTVAAGRWADRQRRRATEALARRHRPTRAVPVRLRSPAGYDLPCRLHLPDAGRWPGVLLVAGALDGARAVEGLSCVLTAPRLAREGFATLVFTPSGREEAPGTEDHGGPLHQAESAAAVRALLGHPAVDPGRVAVVTISFGLVAAMGGLAARPQLARRVRLFIDWEGPGSRRWLVADRVRHHLDDPGWLAEREAVRLVPTLACPYRRFQSGWDHVHGPTREIGLEMVNAAADGLSPDVHLNDACPPFDHARLGPILETAQARCIVGWLHDALA